MRRSLVLLLMGLAASPAWASDFWLRGPDVCGGTSGDGTKYECAASAGAPGAKVTNRAVNVNTGLWGNTSTTVGAGDRVFICGRFDLPLTGADARDFLKVSGVTFDPLNPMEINVACPAGVTNGPAVADPAIVDLKEDYRLRAWTDRGNNTWSTPNDAASTFVTYVACDDPNALGTEKDSTNRAGAGTFLPAAFCEFDSRGVSSTALLVYSKGDPSAYYKNLWASARNFIQVSNPVGVRVIGDTTVSRFDVNWGGALFEHMNNAVYIGTFSSAADFTRANLIRGLACKNMATCIRHDGQAGSTYYLRETLWEGNGCMNIGWPCVWLSGKAGFGTIVRDNWMRDSNQSSSSGAVYIAANLDRTTHPQEDIQVYGNYVDGVDYGKVWPADGHGIYIEEGMKGVRAFSNVVTNLPAPGQVGFIINSAYGGNSHRGSVCINCSGLARQSDSANNGNASGLFEALTGVEISGTLLVISGQAGDAPTFRNIHGSATSGNSSGFVATQSAPTLTPTFTSVNVVGFGANDYYNGSTSAPLPGETKVAPGFRGGASLLSADDVCLGAGSALLGAGTPVGAWVTGLLNEDLGNPPAIGARGLCLGRRAVTARRSVEARAAVQ